MYWLRVGMMVFVLAAVLWTMRFLQKPGTLRQAAEPFLGSDKISLCPTRISWIETPEARLEEHGTKWIRMPRAVSGAAQELDPIEVERWFTRFCSLSFQKVATPVAGASEAHVFKPFLNLGFVSGPAEQVMRAENGDCQIKQQLFHPGPLPALLEALPTLPKQPEPGTPNNDEG